MQIVFLNTFERVNSEREMKERAQVSIGESEGQWSVLWTQEAIMQEEETPASIWFEGGSWEEMMAAFRHGIAVKMGEGYSPIIDGLLDDRKPTTGSGSMYAMLHCYGEANMNAALFDALRDWRRTKAASEKKSAYLVANNRMLWMISAYVPHTAEELDQIPGWGETKQTAYGEEILKLTGTFEQPRPFPLDWVEEALEPQLFTQWLFRQKEAKYKAIMDRQQEKKLLLGAIADGKTLAQLQEELSMPRRDLMERIERLEVEGYDIEPLIQRELQHMPQVEQDQVWEALTIIGDRYLKPVLHQVYGEDQRPGQPLDQLYDRLRLIRLRFRRTHNEAV
ncbi:biotin operon repressor [Paenibacillus phyllosphaerae]|uniref:Biotin operon repressor n=1 Tax=Paenibacillus phyllosphaerae TaxID=274593 RepID=A0A7W5FQU5_9BACL|nr:HRDC domain-containing protein [Paenibacillus phyllosphaerae]MBB3113668.1 biotin operon repressor [Paenibacillus phyllosphaerae]